MQIIMTDLYGVKSVLVEYVNKEKEIITGALCVLYACINTCAYGMITKIWDEISPGWRKGPPSCGLSVLWKSLFNLFLLVLHKYTSYNPFSMFIFFSTSISFSHRSLWCVHFWVTHPVGCKLSDKCALLFMIHRMLYLYIFIMHFGQFKWTHTTHSHGTCLCSLRRATPKCLFTNYNSNSTWPDWQLLQISRPSRHLCLSSLLSSLPLL